MARETKHNHIVTPEKMKIFNQDNVNLQNDFILYLRSLNRSEGTIKGYISDFNMIWTWNLDFNKNKFFVDWKKRDLVSFQNYFCNVLKLGGSRYRRLRSAASSLSNYISNILDDEFDGYKNIMNVLEPPNKDPIREKTVLEDEELESLLNTLVETKQYQKACYLALGMASGARKSELLRFKPEYFKDEYIIYGSLYKTPERIKTKGRDGGKMLYKYTLVDKFKPYFDLWMQERKEKGIDSEWLFVSKRNGEWKQMSISGADGIADKLSKILNKSVYIHSLRHYWCTSLIKASLPENVIKDLQGWSSDMVSTYTDIELDDNLGNYFKDGQILGQKASLEDL